MKSLYTLFLIVALVVSFDVSATTFIVTQSGFTFSPVGLTANVGDTIKWEWTSGSHTTTSVTVPSGAATWDAPLNSGNPNFSYVVQVPGLYAYICTIHAAMEMAGGFQVAGTTAISNVTATSVDFSASIENGTDVLIVRIKSPQASRANIRVLDFMGRQIAELNGIEFGIGENVFKKPLEIETRGIYFVRLELGGKVETKKILVN